MTRADTKDLRPLTATLIARYAERFNAAFADGEHAVTSPLGAWLLLALVAPSADGDAKARLEDVLGTTAADAFARDAALLETPHPAVGLASGLWARRELLTTAYDRFAASLPVVVARGGVPTQPELDAWARKHSLGLIEQFPIEIRDDTAIVLADALATRVQWDEPFEVAAPAEDFLPGEWARRVVGVLRAPTSHDMFIAKTDSAGHVAVHAATSTTGLAVVSVIADSSVPPSSVHRAAHDVAELITSRSQRARRVSLFDLPLRHGHAWWIGEHLEVDPAQTERFSAVLPAWEAENRYDLGNVPTLGFGDAAAVLLDMVSSEWPDRHGTATQVARARYAARGFEAAAMTVFCEVAGEPDEPTEGTPVREAVLHFERPYAVVAVALADGSTESLSRDAFRWHGVPVFSAWVAEPSEAYEGDLPDWLDDRTYVR